MVHLSRPIQHQVHSQSFKLLKTIDQISAVQSILDHFTLCQEILAVVVVVLPLKSHG